MSEIKLIPQASFLQDHNKVVQLLKRKLKRGKLSKMGREFLKSQLK
jgi:hypothetical protein